ncbi:uncharacterized protein LOC120112932 [Phoenix dactylifera]|uniref:Uncharacterized protein LOC120112932 n=1 Tax=Phoenix dactylifera TaxID=42345 RepID=A0A8B9AYY2_PHODC|nr:uncharacterized protein LOC120112932 [Phoenix dactylifera]
MAPSAFKGATSSQEAKAWMDEMEKAFRAMECTDEDKIIFAIYMLQDRTHYWWKSVERTLAHEHEPVTLAEVLHSLLLQVFSSSRLRELEREFLNLSQGTMTVNEYEAEFDRLSRFAPTLIMDAEFRMRRFEEGLKPHLRRGFAAVHSVNYDDLIDKAKNLKIVWKET